MTELPQERLLRWANGEFRRLSDSHARNVRFYVVVNVAFACVGLGLLKMEGPVFADALVAGLFGCGCLLSFVSIRETLRSEQECRLALDRKVELEHKAGLREGEPQPSPRRIRGLVLLFSFFAALHLAAVFATVWLTFVTPLDHTHGEEDAVAANLTRLEACSRPDL